MTMPRDAQNVAFEQTRLGLRRVSDEGAIPPLGEAGTRAVEAWFLGPKAENADRLERLVVEAIRDHAFWRRNFHPGDPIHISEEIKRSPEYLQAMDTLQDSGQLRRNSLPLSIFLNAKGPVSWSVPITT